MTLTMDECCAPHCLNKHSPPLYTLYKWVRLGQKNNNQTGRWVIHSYYRGGGVRVGVGGGGEVKQSRVMGHKQGG